MALKIKRARTYTVVGQLCSSRAAAFKRLKELREADPDRHHEWGVAKIQVSAGEKPFELGKIRLPLPPSLLKRLEGLLLDREVRGTRTGEQALQLVRAALKPRR